tara:strand:+ start:1163 stop:1984 length:822 start_codon:yes stop_codon:yes gene_type:complete
MRWTSILKLLIGYLILFACNSNKPVYSSARILNCSGTIPRKTACLIRANSFKAKIRRIDVCQNNPFPNYRSMPDFSGSKCINLFNSELSSQSDLDRDKKFYLSKDINIQKGGYKYISIILKNKFTVSGKYKADNYFWATSKEGPKKIIQSKSNISIPNEFTTKLTNWRGEKDLDNKYCVNNGGTPSRCDLQYNGFNMTGIGLDSSLIETFGKKTKYIFFVSEISPVVNLNQNSEGYFSINLEKNLEVFGNGSAIQSISIAPFKFKTKYISEAP